MGSIRWPSSPNGRRIVTASPDHTAKLWDAATGRELRTFKGHLDATSSAAFSPDGRWIVTGSYDGTARVWDAADDNNARTLDGPGRLGIRSVAFSADGQRILTGCGDGTAKVWDAASGKELLTLMGLMGSPPWVRAAYSPDGRRIAAWGSESTGQGVGERRSQGSPDPQTSGAGRFTGVGVMDHVSGLFCRWPPDCDREQ